MELWVKVNRNMIQWAVPTVRLSDNGRVGNRRWTAPWSRRKVIATNTTAVAISARRPVRLLILPAAATHITPEPNMARRQTGNRGTDAAMAVTGRRRHAMALNRMMIGTLNQNAPRQPPNSAKIPPIMGPSIAAMPHMADMVESARVRMSSG